MSSEQKITKEHLARKAIVYLRQSSEKQVRNNLESQRLQYAMADRARELGFRVVEVIDVDLGSSAAMAAAKREGFQKLLGAVAMGEVGIVLARELSRLLRTDRDLCQLVELCHAFDTLIGDEQAVYDPSHMNDQLVLGIKATMSVAELKVIHMRLALGKENTARRGELYPRLPAGYVWDLDHKIVKDPNRRVQDGIDLVFKKFRETWSSRQTHKWFQGNGVELAVTKASGGSIRVEFQIPRPGQISAILHNPIYAGAYVWGRRRTEVRWEEGALKRRQGPASTIEEAKVFLKDHHEGYIDWSTYEENQLLIKRNDFRGPPDETAGVARSGKGLLAGLMRCGHCGRKFYVRYWGKSGTSARYLCSGTAVVECGRYCIGFGGATIDRRVEAEVGRALTPHGVRASLAAIADLTSAEEERKKIIQRHLQQLEYEAGRAFEQFNAVDPKNRLVADELERRWNAKLADLDACRESLLQLDAERPAITEEEKAKLTHLGEHFIEAWSDPRCSVELKKQIIRTLIEEIVVNEEPVGTLAVTIRWSGGTHTAFEMQKPSPSTMHRTSEDDLEVIRKMAARYGDADIARVLSKLGRTTGKGHPWTQFSVKSARKTYHIEGRAKSLEDDQVLTQHGAARYTNTSDTTIKKLVDAGVVPMNRCVPYAPWEIQRSDLETPRMRRILETLRQTGRLQLGDPLSEQGALFPLDDPETKER